MFDKVRQSLNIESNLGTIIDQQTVLSSILYILCVLHVDLKIFKLYVSVNSVSIT